MNELINQETQQERAVGWYHYGQVEAAHLRRLLDSTVAEHLLQSSIDLLTDVIGRTTTDPTAMASSGWPLLPAPAGGP